MGVTSYEGNICSSRREIYIGKVKSEYKWKPDKISEEYPHIRGVEWKKKVSRDKFSTPARNSLGSSLTVFSLDEYLSEIKSLLRGEEPTEEEAPLFRRSTESSKRMKGGYHLLTDMLPKY